MTRNSIRRRPHTSASPGSRTSALNTDRTFYSVVCSLEGEAYSRETDLADMDLDRIVRDISDEQIENVIAVFAFNPAEGWANDVTADVLAAAFPEGEDDEGPDGAGSGRDDPSDDSGERIGAFEAGCGRWAA